MYVCVECQAEMKCDKNEVGADVGHGMVYAGDRYICPVCGRKILATNRISIHDPGHKTQEEYLEVLVRP